ncbi:MAG: cysteine synthase A [Clostridia bacterium]|nr:cysteine synthase A [Clostridia bacterium]
MNIKKSIGELIGKTPIIELVNIEKEYSLKGKLFAKLEYVNPTGSIKDRTAFNMIKDAEERGILKQGATIIEPTSGNTGIGLCAICADKGYKAIIVMPDTMSQERILLMKAYGAEVVLTSGELGMKGCIDKANELQKSTPNSFIPSQFENEANSQIHYLTTGKEIFEDMDGKVDIFVSTIGTGGTITGTAKYLKSKNKDIKVVGIEPLSSPLITQNKVGLHKIQGIGANFIPKILDLTCIDEIMTISDEDAYECGRIIAQKQGLLCGISSGACLKAGILLAQKEENKDKNIVLIFPDSGSRYLTTLNYFVV